MADHIDNYIDEQTPSIESTLKEMAFGMVKFGIGMAVLKTGSKIAAKGMFGAISKNQGLAAKISTTLGKSQEVLRKDISLSGLYKGVTHAVADNPNLAFGGGRAGRILSAASKVSVEAGRTGALIHKDLMGSKNIAARSAGKIGAYFAKNAGASAGFYMLERAFGTRPPEYNAAWYNVPGHIKGIGRVAVENAVFDKAIGGLKSGFKGVKNLGAKYLAADKNPGMYKFLDKTFAIHRKEGGATPGTFLNAVTKSAAFLDATRSYSREMGSNLKTAISDRFGNAEARRNATSSLFNYNVKSISTYHKKAVDNAKGAYRSGTERLANYRADNGFNMMTALTAMLAKHNQAPIKTFTDTIRANGIDGLPTHAMGVKTTDMLLRPDSDGSSSFIKTLLDKVKEHDTLISRGAKGQSQLTGRRLATVGEMMQINPGDDKQINAIFKGLKDNAAEVLHSPIDELKTSFLQSYAGKHVYKTNSGIIDYSMWSPRNVMSSFVRWAHPAFKVGILDRGIEGDKLLGLQHRLAKEGTGIFSTNANEPQYYNHINSNYKKEFRRLGSDADQRGLGGIVVGDKLFEVGADGALKEMATEAGIKMVYNTPYARESILYKLNADISPELPKVIQRFSKMADDLDNEPGVINKMSRFFAARGLQTPTPISWLSTRIQQGLGIGPKTKGVKSAVEFLIGPKHSQLSKGDYSVIMNSFGQLGSESQHALYESLTDPRVLDDMSRIGKTIGTPGVEAKVSTLKKLLSNGTSDQEFINLLSSNETFKNDAQVQYAINHFSEFGSYILNESATKGFKFGKRPLTRREELISKLTMDTLGDSFGMTGDASGNSMYYNFADDLLKDNSLISKLGADRTRHLKMVATRAELHNNSLLKNGSVVDTSGEAQKKAFDIINKRLSDERHFIEQGLYDTGAIQGIGLFNNRPSDPFRRKSIDFKRQLNENLTDTGYNPLSSENAVSPYLLTNKHLGVDNLLGKTNYFIDRVLEMGSFFGLKYGMKERADTHMSLPDFQKFKFLPDWVQKLSNTSVEVGGPLKHLTKRVAQGVGYLAAAQALDTFVDINPLFEGTILKDGIFTAAADVYVKGSMAYHKAQDLTGVTQAAKYLDGLMPGSLSSIPGGVIGGMTKGPLGIIPGMFINRAMDAVGLYPNLDKSYEEMADIYSGRELVPVRKGRYWLFSKGAYEGQGIQYFRPSWYPRLKSQYKYTDTLYGSKGEAFLYKPWTGLGFNPIGHVLDKYHYEKKHYWDRPAPLTEPMFSDIPLLGSLLGATIGQLPIIGKPVKNMHLDEMSSYYSMSGSTANGINKTDQHNPALSNMPNVSQSEQYEFMNKARNSSLAERELLGGTAPQKPLSPVGVHTLLGEQIYNFTEFAGLPGYKLETLMGGHPYDNRERLSTAGEMWSTRRAFWDMNMGDFVNTEMLRRFIPQEKKIWKKVNPLKNRLDTWLPGGPENEFYLDFLSGDAFCVSGNTLIESNNKLIKAKDLYINDVILSHKGNILPIKNIIKRKILNDEKCYSLKVTTISSGKMEFSESHPIYTRTGWKQIKDIDEGEYVGYPIENFKNNIMIDISKYVDLPYDENYVYIQGTQEYVDCVNYIENNKNIHYKHGELKIILDEKKWNRKTFENAQRGIRYKSLNRIKRFINSTSPDFNLICGYYISEGSIGDCLTSFAFNKNEVSTFIKLLDNAFYNEFGIRGKVYYSKQLYKDRLTKGCNYIVCNKVLSLFFKNFIGSGFDKKIIPNDLFNSDSCKYLLKGIFDGDGSYFFDKGKARLSLKLSNPILLYQVRKLLLSIGFVGSIIQNNLIIRGINAKKCALYTQTKYKDTKDSVENVYFIEDNYVWMKVLSKKEIKLDYVYGFEVDKDDSFCVYGIATHNTKIPEGEMRLPGAAYEKLYDVRHTFPGRASSFGKNILEHVRTFTGMDAPFTEETEDILESGTELHRIIQDNLLKANVAAKEEQFVYDVKNDISGHVDLLMYDPSQKGGMRALEIKSMSAKKFAKLKGPEAKHVSQLNFYIRQLQGDGVGTLLYINRDDPTQIRTFDVRYNEQRFRKDLQDLQKAREIASGQMIDGKGKRTGASYSWLDRYRILADVAPTSDNFRTAKKVVQAQLKAGMLTEQDKEEITKIERQRRAVQRKVDLYPIRFKGRLFNPDTQYELWSENKNIKAAGEYGFTERCFDKDTLIKTNLCTKKIIDININDLVLTHNNQYKHVTKVTNRIPEKNEIIYDVKFVGLPSIKVTEEHPFYVIKTEKCVNWSHKKTKCVKKQNKKCINCKYKKYDDYKPEWLPIKYITDDYYVLSPIPNFNNNDDKLDLWKYLKKYKELSTDNTHIYFNKINKKNISIPRYIEKTKQLYKLFGWYIAEGCRNKSIFPYNGINFSLHKKELNIALELFNILKDVFNVKKYNIYNKCENGITINIYSSLVAIVFYELFGHSAEKKYIHNDVLNADTEILKELVFNYSKGDGYKIKNKNNIKSISPSLIYTCYDILRYAGYNCTITIEKGGKKVKIHNNKNYTITKDVFILNWYDYKKYNGDNFILDNMSYHRFKNKKNIIINKVYNLEVEDDHSYTANGVSVHNSIGNIWERFVSLDTPLHNKLYNMQNPLQHYKRTKVYGSESSAWNKPLQDLINPMFRKAFAAENPVESAAAFGWIGALGLGGFGDMAVPGAVFGGLFGAAKTVVGGDAWIPGAVDEKREIQKTFDMLKYQKNMDMYELTGDNRYFTEASKTMWHIANSSKEVGLSQSMKAMYNMEKPYFLAWVQETNPIERENILQMVPEDVGNMLREKWGLSQTLPAPSEYQRQFSNEEWVGFNQDVQLDDIKVKTIEQAGLSTHDFGLGYYDQQRRIANSPHNLEPLSDRSTVTISNQKLNVLRTSLVNQLSAFCRRPGIRISYTNGDQNKATVRLTITRDRYKEFAKQVRGY